MFNAIIFLTDGGFEALVGAGLDYAGVGSIVAAFAAMTAMIMNHQNNKRTSANTETVTYVDTNLKTLQATITILQSENDRKDVIIGKQGIELEKQAEEIARMEVELAECKTSCARMERRLDELRDER
jgi:hypothetical protein